MNATPDPLNVVRNPQHYTEAEHAAASAAIDAGQQPAAALAAALADLANVFGDGMTAGQVGPRFNCGEAEMIARVLRLAGHADAAETWLDGHVQDDDEDEHDDDEHIARAERIEAEREAWWDNYTGESAARRILSDAGLTMPGMHVNRTTDGRGAVHIYAPNVTGTAEPAPARLARAVDLLTAQGWTVTDGPNARMRRATQPAA